MKRIELHYFMMGIVECMIGTSRESGMRDVNRISYIPDNKRCFWVITDKESYLFTCNLNETLEAHNLWWFNGVRAIYDIALNGDTSGIQNISSFYIVQ